MKIFVISVVVFMFCLPIVVNARRDTGPPEWTFDDVAELAEWQDYHDLEPISIIKKIRDAKGIERSVLVINTTGDNPYVYPGGSVPNWDSFSGYDNETIYIGLRVEESDLWQIDYITSRSGQYDQEKSKKFPVEASPDFVDMEFEMRWDDMITGFRIHPGTNRNRTAEIDYVSLRGPVKVTPSPRRLATTWGRIKDLF
jgi:hypothetical protein